MPKRGGEVSAEHWDHPAGLCPVLTWCPCAWAASGEKQEN